MRKPSLPARAARGPRRRIEHNEQVALFDFLARFSKRYPALALPFAIPNAGKRDGRQGADMVAEGMKAGVWDIFVPAPWKCGGDFVHCPKYLGMFIEMKSPGKSPSPEQKTFREAVEPMGYKFIVCYSWVEAAREVMAYLGINDDELERQLWVNTKGATL